MRLHLESKQTRYDVIVIGSGIGGLTAAALLAKAGKTVLVIERHNRPGGYAHAFTRQQYVFDSAVHAISGCDPTGDLSNAVIHHLFDALGVRDQLEFIPIKQFAYMEFPEHRIQCATGKQAFIATLTQHFPNQNDGLQRLFTLISTVARQASIADQVQNQTNASVPAASVLDSIRELLRYRRASLTTVLDEYIDDAQLKSILAFLWPYIGLPPQRLSFLYWAIMFNGYILDGAFYCKGSFQRMADVLATSITDNGGELLYRMSVRNIVVENGKAAGIVTENGQTITAPLVISNADAQQTFEHLLPASHTPRAHLQKIQTLEVSSSVFVVYIATDLDLTPYPQNHEFFFYKNYNHEANFSAAQEGEPDWLSATIQTHSDPTLAPAGTHLMLLSTLAPYDLGDWRTLKDRYQQCLLDMAEQHFPGLSKHLLLVESGSPRTMQRYTSNQQGSAYGWSPSPKQIGPGRPDVKTPVPGLYQAGHWTRPGGGVNGVAISGILAAQSSLGITDQQQFWDTLKQR